jgi:hypothetical protein
MLPILHGNLLRGYVNSSAVFNALYGKNHRTISTTRDKNYVNSRNSLSIPGDVVFVLDGDKLASKYKRRPIDDRYDTINKKLFDISYGDEQEELWYGKQIEKDKGIKDIKKYIKKVIFTKHFINYIKNTNPSLIFSTIFSGLLGHAKFYNSSQGNAYRKKQLKNSDLVYLQFQPKKN